MTKYQAWKLYGRYVLRRIGKRARSLLARVFPGIAPAARRPRAKRGVQAGAKQGSADA
jgi:arylamine N-acetyltransferase